MASLHTHRETSDALTSSYPAQGHIVGYRTICASNLKFPGNGVVEHHSCEVQSSSTHSDIPLPFALWLRQESTI